MAAQHTTISIGPNMFVVSLSTLSTSFYVNSDMSALIDMIKGLLLLFTYFTISHHTLTYIYLLRKFKKFLLVSSNHRYIRSFHEDLLNQCLA